MIPSRYSPVIRIGLACLLVIAMLIVVLLKIKLLFQLLNQ